MKGLRRGSSSSSISSLISSTVHPFTGQHLLSIGFVTFPAVLRAKSFSNDFSYPYDAFIVRSCDQEVSKSVENTVWALDEAVISSSISA